MSLIVSPYFPTLMSCQELSIIYNLHYMYLSCDVADLLGVARAVVVAGGETHRVGESAHYIT